MRRRRRTPRPGARLRPIPQSAPPGGPEATPLWQLLGACLLLTALWALVLAALSMMFAPGPWLPRALTITTATVTVACVARLLQPHRHLFAAICGTLAGLALSAFWLIEAGRQSAWWDHPQAMADEIRWRLLVDTAPLETGGPLQDVVLLAIFLAAAITVLMLVGRGHPLFAGAFAALLLLIPSAATGESVGWLVLAGTGVLLTLLAWIGSPSPGKAGILAAVLAVAVATAAMAIAPATRDRVWNEASPTSPFSATVPDVTLALAENLSQPSSSLAFRFKSAEPGPYRFTLATLADFSGGRWQPQDDLNQGGLVVSDPRSVDLLTPEPAEVTAAASAVVSATVTIDGLLSDWLPLPQSTARVAEAEDPAGFDPEQWRWTANANTARAEMQGTRRGNTYVAEVRRDGPGAISPEVLAALPPDATRLVSGPGSDADDEADELAPYLGLPEELPEAIADAAERVAGSASDRLAVGRALEGWFRSGEFAYDEEAPYRPGLNPDDPYQVIEALLTERSGFCVHYASAFAVMARYLGAPTRIAVGYATRALDGEFDTFVGGRELHAWPEIYVAGAGWVTFEPTPGGAGVRSDGVDRERAEGLPAGPAPAETQEGTPEAESERQRARAIPDEESATAGNEQSEPATGEKSAAPRAVAIVLAALVAVALLCTPAVKRWLRARRRARAIAAGDRPASHAWEELRDTAADLALVAPAEGRAGPRAQTAEALIDHLEAQHALAGSAAAAARVLADRMVDERYGAGSTDRDLQGPGGPADISELLRISVDELRAGTGFGARLQARLLPRSIRPGR